MSVGFTVSLNGQIPEPLPVLSLEYNHPALLQAGTATILVPRDSPAYTATHIDERQPFVVKIDSRLGRWTGIALGKERAPEGYRLECSHIARLLGTKLALQHKVYDGPWMPHLILEDVLRITFGGLDGPRLLPGTRCVANEPLTDYALQGRYVSDIVIDLMQQTGMEWRLRDEYLELAPPVAPEYAPLLCEGAGVVDVHRRIDHNDQVYTVKSRSEDNELEVAALSNTGIWSPEIALDTELPDFHSRALEAAHEASERSFPEVPIGCALPDIGTTWATVREGMTLRILAPSMGFTDQLARVRVLTRRYQAGSGLLQITGQFLFWPDKLGLAGVGQELPPIPRGKRTTKFEEAVKTLLLFLPQQQGV